MKVLISLSAGKGPLRATSLLEGDPIIRVSKGKSYPGVVTSVTTKMIELKFREIGVERFEPSTFDRMVDRGVLKAGKAEQSAGIKGGIRKAAFRDRVKAGPVVPASVKVTSDLENRLMLQLSAAYGEDEGKRNNLIEAILLTAKSEGYYDKFVESYPITKDLRKEYPGVSIEPWLSTDYPSREEFNTGTRTPLSPNGLRVRIKGMTHFVLIGGVRSAPKGYKVTIGADSKTLYDFADIVSYIASKQGKLKKLSSKVNDAIHKSARVSRVNERASIYDEAIKFFDIANAMVKRNKLIEKKYNSDKKAGRLPTLKRNDNTVALLERLFVRVLEHWAKVNRTALDLSNDTAGEDSDDVTSADIMAYKRRGKGMALLADKADTLQGEMERAAKKLGVELNKSNKPIPRNGGA